MPRTLSLMLAACLTASLVWAQPVTTQPYAFINVYGNWGQTPEPTADSVARIARLRQMFLSDRVSWGQYDIQGTFMGSYPLLTATDCPYSGYIQKAVDAASAAGYIFTANMQIVVLSSCGDFLSAVETVQVQGLTLRGIYQAVPKNDNLVAWAIGHLLGLLNSGAEYCATGTCSSSIAGDFWTFMSEGGGNSMNASQRYYEGWLPISAIRTTSVPGSYRVRVLELPLDGSPQALRVGSYWIDVRATGTTPIVLVHTGLFATLLLDLDRATACVQRALPIGQVFPLPITPTLGVRVDALTSTYADVSIVGGSPVSTIVCAGAGKGDTSPLQTTCTKNCGTPPPPPPPPAEICGDGIDNDGDGLIDEGCTTPPPPLSTLPSVAKFSVRIGNGDIVADLTDNWAAPSSMNGIKYLWNVNPTLSQNPSVGGVYALVNFEHTFTSEGNAAHPFPQPDNLQWPWFTPRYGPFRMTIVSPTCVQMTREAADEPWRIKTVMTYCANGLDYLDVHIEHTLMDLSVLGTSSYIGFFYASYASQQESLATMGLNMLLPNGVISLVDPQTSSCGNYRAFGDAEIAKGDSAGTTPVYHSDDTIQFAEPWYYTNFANNMKLGYLFRNLPPNMRLRFTFCKYAVKPPVLTPALDWQAIIDHPVQGQPYGYDVRLPWAPGLTADDVHRMYHAYVGVPH